jgi:hypothetical protein
MAADEDDKPTVVIDLKALKKAKELQEKAIAEASVDISFGVEEEGPAPVIFFEFGGHYFKDLPKLVPPGMKYEVVGDLPTLNKWLKSKAPLIMVFAFDSNPSVISQLCAQLRSKFKHITTVIVAEKLSPKKIQIHRQSPAAASGYLSYPFQQNELKSVLIALTEKKAA